MNRLVGELEDYMSYQPPLIRMGLLMMIRGMEVAPLALGYRHQFSNLSKEDQVKALADFEASQKLRPARGYDRAEGPVADHLFIRAGSRAGAGLRP
ncbi:MAG: hypothetical protein MZU91_06845 [Desulfosudis oleivorans]|nr:hypothetical protein [Desulfosudis oleivorans]